MDPKIGKLEFLALCQGSVEEPREPFQRLAPLFSGCRLDKDAIILEPNSFYLNFHAGLVLSFRGQLATFS